MSSIDFEEIKNSLNNWEIPKIPISEIYYKSCFPFRSNQYIKTYEKTISIDPAQKIVQLLSKEDLEEIPSAYKFLHLVFVQVAVKPLTRKGLNISILGCLRDCRNLRFTDSLLGLI